MPAAESLTPLPLSASGGGDVAMASSLDVTVTRLAPSHGASTGGHRRPGLSSELAPFVVTFAVEVIEQHRQLPLPGVRRRGLGAPQASRAPQRPRPVRDIPTPAPAGRTPSTAPLTPIAGRGDQPQALRGSK
jgi:hypothetical protein